MGKIIFTTLVICSLIGCKKKNVTPVNNIEDEDNVINTYILVFRHLNASGDTATLTINNTFYLGIPNYRSVKTGDNVKIYHQRRTQLSPDTASLELYLRDVNNKETLLKKFTGKSITTWQQKIK